MTKPTALPGIVFVALTCSLAASCKTPKETEPSPATPSAASDVASSNEAPKPAELAESAELAPAQPNAAAPAASSAGPVPEAASSAPPEPEALPNVEVKNIGMHIGGGPNDRDTKQPIKESVQPHFDGLRRCWKHVDDPSKGGDFGVDLLIPREGGKAEVSHPRSALKGEGFEACVVEVFQTIDFKRPKTGKTMVSYSIRYTPKK